MPGLVTSEPGRKLPLLLVGTVNTAPSPGNNRPLLVYRVTLICLFIKAQPGRQAGTVKCLPQLICSCMASANLEHTPGPHSLHPMPQCSTQNRLGTTHTWDIGDALIWSTSERFAIEQCSSGLGRFGMCSRHLFHSSTNTGYCCCMY